ncbi:hypothetical protein [Rhodococcus sp. NPDC058521]|uniref:hypothetical protein n=1 Tax=Rhodococcus sp. NPDC058521 TaxID=3346536 RepID=UPI0036538E0F
MTATTELLDADGNFDTDVIPAISAPIPDDSADSFCESIVRVAASALGAPVAYVSIVDSGYEVLVGAVDREGVRPTSSATIPGLVSRAEQEIRTEDGVFVGTLCVADRCERNWAEADFAQLAELGDLLVPQFDQRVATPAPASSLSTDLAVLADSVSTLFDLAEQHDDPKLQRYAATSRRRLASVLESAESANDTRSIDPSVFDLRHAVNRALRESVFVTGRDRVVTDLGGHVLSVDGGQFGVERAVNHLVCAVLDHTGYGDTRVSLESDPDNAFLTVSAEDCALSAAEVARIAANFAETTAAAGASSIRLIGGEVVASSDGVHATSGPFGTTFVVRWSLARG